MVKQRKVKRKKKVKRKVYRLSDPQPCAGVPAPMTPDTAYASPFHDSKSPAWGPESVSGTPAKQPPVREGAVQAGGNEVYELASAPSAPVEMPAEPVTKS